MVKEATGRAAMGLQDEACEGMFRSFGFKAVVQPQAGADPAIYSLLE
jgi:hypothetical protein